MKRRALALWPLAAAAQAQPRPTTPKIGYLHPRTLVDTHPTLMILRQAWRKLGYVEGQTLLMRSANGDAAKLPALTQQLIDEGVAALIVVGASAVRAASLTTKSVPIVAIDLETDPVRAGYAASYAKPGGNVTGLFLDQPALAGKWIDLLRETVPGIERLAILWDASTGANQLEVARTVARSRGFDAVVLEVHRMANVDQGLRHLAGRPRTGMVQLSSPGASLLAPALAAAALRYQLPLISFLRAYAESGVLMTYGPVQETYFARAVPLADRLARGQRAGDTPIEGPDRFEFVINLKTAQAMGLTLPPAVLLRADEVIR